MQNCLSFKRRLFKQFLRRPGAIVAPYWYNNKYLNNLENYHSINEILDYYNLNRFDKFNFNKRYVIKEKNNIVFIKILFSDINNWDIILSKIFNKNIKIYSANLTKNKNNIYSLYEKFKKEYKIPKSYINKELKNDIEFQIYNKKSEKSLILFPGSMV